LGKLDRGGELIYAASKRRQKIIKPEFSSGEDRVWISSGWYLKRETGERSIPCAFEFYQFILFLQSFQQTVDFQFTHLFSFLEESIDWHWAQC
jgi:hypothetical protein